MKKALINDRLRKKVGEALAEGKKFMLYRIPEYAPKLVMEKDTRTIAYITPWREGYTGTHVINVDDEDPVKPSFHIPETTDKQQYISRLESLIPTLASRGNSKTVISRVIAGRADVNWIAVAEDLWTAYPNSFGYLFYTPKTGAWLGASPEKLLITIPPNHFTTQALAGTLPVDTDWNVKNYEEQQIVADYIGSVLSKNGIEYKAIGPKDLVYGNIKHLSTTFTGLLNANEPVDQAFDLMKKLAPTPALSGYPRGDAFDDIDDIEDHDRSCYGGHVIILNQQKQCVNSYVIIRCVQFDPVSGKWAIYSGGGITPKSDPETEWNETEAKASKLKELINVNAK